MSFAEPRLLWALVAVPVAVALYVWSQRRRRRYAVRFTNLDLLESVVTASPRWRRHVPAALVLVAVTALLAAVARPQVDRRVPRDTASVVLAIDVSGSMRATDVEPTRMAAAQRAAERFVQDLPSRFLVGLVTFSDAVQVAAPPTTDRDRVLLALDAVVADGGTAMGEALHRAVELATPPPSDGLEEPASAVVLLSDGFNTTGLVEPVPAAERAAALGVPVFTIALGTDEASIVVRDRFGQLRSVPVPPDRTTLREVAEASGGRAFDAPSEADLDAIYDGLGSRISFAVEPQEVTAYAALGALVALALAAAMSLAWFGRLP